MQRFLRIIKVLFLAGLLTVITQVGGAIYLLYQPLGSLVRQKVKPGFKQKGLRFATFLSLYLISTFLLVPLIAKKEGRVPLPWYATAKVPVRPHNFLVSSLLNRHYVKPELKQLLIDAAREMRKMEPDLYISYLDANFPFWDEFPLLPHISHDDGRKVDIAFLYRYKSDASLRKKGTSFLGYGVCEGPKAGEVDWPAQCVDQGEWQYSALKKITPQRRHQLQFDAKLNQQLLRILATDSRTGKIFIEKHLENRLGLNSYHKIRQAGCHSVRHDDHIHVQL